MAFLHYFAHVVEILDVFLATIGICLLEIDAEPSLILVPIMHGLVLHICYHRLSIENLHLALKRLQLELQFLQFLANLLLVRLQQDCILRRAILLGSDREDKRISAIAMRWREHVVELDGGRARNYGKRLQHS